MIEIDGVSKEFVKGERRVLAIDDISLRVAEREFVAILGPSRASDGRTRRPC